MVKVSAQACVHIVDDDLALGQSIAFFLEAKQIASVQYSSAEEFMAATKTLDWDKQVGCILLDVRMSGLSGMDLFYWLAGRDKRGVLPVIFMTGHGELPMAVQVMKRGAFDFVQKPFDSDHLLQLLEAAIKLSKERSSEIHTKSEIERRLQSLSDKELLVMSEVFLGASNKEIAEKIGNSVRTVELHRAQVYEKMDVKSGIDLARLLERVGWEGKRAKS
jgi:two-component system, LuxR family, response regulator DctR